MRSAFGLDSFHSRCLFKTQNKKLQNPKHAIPLYIRIPPVSSLLPALSMRFCTLVTQKAMPQSFCRTAFRSVGSSASAAPTSPPPTSPSATDPKQFSRTPEELRLENHSYEESIVSSCRTPRFLYLSTPHDPLLTNAAPYCFSQHLYNIYYIFLCVSTNMANTEATHLIWYTKSPLLKWKVIWPFVMEEVVLWATHWNTYRSNVRVLLSTASIVPFVSQKRKSKRKEKPICCWCIE